MASRHTRANWEGGCGTTDIATCRVRAASRLPGQARASDRRTDCPAGAGHCNTAPAQNPRRREPSSHLIQLAKGSITAWRTMVMIHHAKHALIKFSSLLLFLVLGCADASFTDAGQPKFAILQCTNAVSNSVWTVHIDFERQTVDSFPATITNNVIKWRNPAIGGQYILDRTSGELTVTRASSTGGFSLTHKCQWVR